LHRFGVLYQGKSGNPAKKCFWLQKHLDSRITLRNFCCKTARFTSVHLQNESDQRISLNVFRMRGFYTSHKRNSFTNR
jgi:hypothetical protein